MGAVCVKNSPYKRKPSIHPGHLVNIYRDSQVARVALMRKAKIHPRISHGILNGQLLEHNGNVLEHNRANFVELPKNIIGRF